jgi:hypothetical protein
MAITGTQQPSSPSIKKESSGNKVYTRVFKYARDYAWEAEMPAIGSFDATYGYFRGYTSNNAEAYVTVTLTYDTEGTVVNFSPGDGDTEYWAQTVGEEKPVEYHASYRTKWNYGLYVKNNGGALKTVADYPNIGGAGAGSASYNASTTPDDLATETEIAWFKDHPGAEWVRILKPTKGNDFYLAPTRAVFQRDYHRTQASAEADLNDVGKLVVPAEAFGATPSTTANWLVNSSNTQYDGKYWVTETEFWHSENGWDSDIYSVP